jgi:hypothetical protein
VEIVHQSNLHAIRDSLAVEPFSEKAAARGEFSFFVAGVTWGNIEVRGGGIIVSISGQEEKLRVLSSKPDRYVFDMFSTIT